MWYKSMWPVGSLD